MQKIKLKKHFMPKLKPLNIVFIVLISIIITVLILLKYLSNQITPIMFEYSKTEAKKISGIVINEAVAKYITEKVDPDELFNITKDDNGEIKSVDFNAAIVNKYLTDATTSIQQELRNIEKGNIDKLEYKDYIFEDYDKDNLKEGIIYRFSLGSLWDSNILYTFGPKIPVKINILGNVTSKIDTSIKNYGINNALIEVYVELNVTEKLILPFFNKDVKINTKIPVAMKLVTGTVPSYYVDGENAPSVTIPSN